MRPGRLIFGAQPADQPGDGDRVPAQELLGLPGLFLVQIAQHIRQILEPLFKLLLAPGLGIHPVQHVPPPQVLEQLGQPAGLRADPGVRQTLSDVIALSGRALSQFFGHPTAVKQDHPFAEISDIGCCKGAGEPELQRQRPEQGRQFALVLTEGAGRLLVEVLHHHLEHLCAGVAQGRPLRRGGQHHGRPAVKAPQQLQHPLLGQGLHPSPEPEQPVGLLQQHLGLGPAEQKGEGQRAPPVVIGEGVVCGGANARPAGGTDRGKLEVGAV